MLKEILEEVKGFKRDKGMLKYVYVFVGPENEKQINQAIGKMKLPLKARRKDDFIYIQSKNPLDIESLNKGFKENGITGKFLEE